MRTQTGLGECKPLTSNEKRLRRNQRVWLGWLLLFMACFMLGGWMFRSAGWAPEGSLAVALSLIPLIPGAMAFRAFLRFAREADEMMREVLVEGMLFGFASAVVFWGAVQLPEHVWLPAIKASHLMGVLLFGFSFGVIRAQWRRK